MLESETIPSPPDMGCIEAQAFGPDVMRSVLEEISTQRRLAEKDRVAHNRAGEAIDKKYGPRIQSSQVLVQSWQHKLQELDANKHAPVGQEYQSKRAGLLKNLQGAQEALAGVQAPYQEQVQILRNMAQGLQGHIVSLAQEWAVLSRIARHMGIDLSSYWTPETRGPAAQATPSDEEA